MWTASIGYMWKPGEQYEIQWSTGVLAQVQSKKKNLYKLPELSSSV